jgi:hypothetical protein
MKPTVALVWFLVLAGTAAGPLFYGCTDKAPTATTVCPSPDAGDGGDAGCSVAPATIAGGGGW